MPSTTRALPNLYSLRSLNFRSLELGTSSLLRRKECSHLPSALVTKYFEKLILLTGEVRMPRLELGTSSLSVTRSNHLSYTRTSPTKTLIFQNTLPPEPPYRSSTPFGSFRKNLKRSCATVPSEWVPITSAHARIFLLRNVETIAKKLLARNRQKACSGKEKGRAKLGLSGSARRRFRMGP